MKVPPRSIANLNLPPAIVPIRFRERFVPGMGGLLTRTKTIEGQNACSLAYGNISVRVHCMCIFFFKLLNHCVYNRYPVAGKRFHKNYISGSLKKINSVLLPNSRSIFLEKFFFFAF